MQEEVENRTVTLAVSTTKMTGRVLKWAMSKYLSHKNNKKIEKARDSPVTSCGKVTLQELKAQDPNLANIEITDSNIKDFDRVARKYGIDYAVKKDTTEAIPKYLVFFKARDGDALNAAFREYSSVVAKKKARPSVIQKLRALNPLQLLPKQQKERHKKREQER